MKKEIRWHYRFKNFSRAYLLLQEALEDIEQLNELETEGVIKRFEYSLELAWKTMKDYLEFNGFLLVSVTPKDVIRTAYQAKLIDDVQVWINMITDRNLMAHTYDFEKFDKVVQALREKYLLHFSNLYEKLALECTSKN